MRKANLYEAILLVNRGIDEALLGLERLMSLENSPLDRDHLDEKYILFEEQRARLNAYLCGVLEGQEERDADGFEAQYAKYRKEILDEVQVYRDVQAVEERRRAEGRAPRIQFLTEQEQQDWERQYSKPSEDAASRGTEGQP
jgi:hypothetical protein